MNIPSQLLSLDPELAAAWEGTSTGYRVECAVPWAALGLDGPPSAGVMGVDAAMGSCDDAGVAQFLNWTGRPNGWRDPSVFGVLVLL